jgi:hypothetical protein
MKPREKEHERLGGTAECRSNEMIQRTRITPDCHQAKPCRKERSDEEEGEVGDPAHHCC